MRLLSIVPREGVALAAALEELRAVRYSMQDAKAPGPWDPLLRYQQWSNQAARRLLYSYEDDRVEQLIMGPRFRLLHSVFGTVADIVNMVHAEFEARERKLDELIDQYEQIRGDWATSTVELLALDTNTYIHQKTPFDAMDWPQVVGAPVVRIVVPEITVRELDRQKTYGKKVPVVEGTKEQVPTRARHTVQKLRAFLKALTAANVIRAGLEIEYLANPLDHQRLDDPDSEFIDRCLSMQRLTGRRVLVATSDTGMELMCRMNGLEVVAIGA